MSETLNLGLDRGAFRHPFYLYPNRVKRTYEGGMLLEKFRRYEKPVDGWFPEDWVGSTSLARCGVTPTEGYSYVRVTEREITLRRLIEDSPEAILGAGHVAKFGSNSSLLVKLLDSRTRLRIQVHPSRRLARQLLGSDYGKTEAWIVLDTRRVNTETPYLLLGFKEGITRSDFEKAVMKQNSTRLAEMLHRVPVRPGDVFFVESGTPHAIGPGVFMVEVQEPSDHTIYVEPSGDDLLAEGSANNLGLGWDDAFRCFNYEGLTLDEVAKRWKKQPTSIQQGEYGEKHMLLGCPQVSKYFRAYRLVVNRTLRSLYREYHIAVVTQGKGLFTNDYGDLPVESGDALFIPAAVGEHTWQNASIDGSPLEVITCHPPVSAT